MNVIGYVRVSTSGQANHGVSLDAQREKIQAWAFANDATVVAVHVDAGLSGGRADNRPALQDAIEDIRRGKGRALVVYSLSRLARSTKDTLRIADLLQDSGADLVSLTEKIDTTTAAGKMVFRLLAVLSEFERDLISERTTAALAHMRSQGRRVSGRIPFGFDLAQDGKTLVANPEEQEAIQEMGRLRNDGHTLREIASRLDARGTLSKTGKQWSPEAVRVVLRRDAARA
jgi:DNA invertase Pin-like site-specific DNA recombinase